MDKIQYSTTSWDLLNDVIGEAKNLSRKRLNLNIHRDANDSVQKLFNACLKNTYFPPHLHEDTAGDEFILIIDGRCAVLFFDQFGAVSAIEILSADKRERAAKNAINISAGVYHSLIILSEQAILFEAKEGPYDKNKAKFIAPWAPPENSNEAEAYLKNLMPMQDGDVTETLADTRLLKHLTGFSASDTTSRIISIASASSRDRCV